MSLALKNDNPTAALAKVRQGRLFLLLAIAAAVVAALEIRVNNGSLFLICWALTLVCGFVGMNFVGRSMSVSSVENILGLLALFLPTLNVLSLAYFLAKSAKTTRIPKKVNSGLATETPNREKPAPSSSSNSRNFDETKKTDSSEHLKARDSVNSALAQLKIVGLQHVPNGTRLEVSLQHQGAEFQKEDEPVFLGQKGIFGAAYLIDEGRIYSYVTVGQINSAGITFDTLHEIGVKNLAALVDGHEPGLRIQELGNSYGLVLDGQFEAALVLLDSLWDGPLNEFIPNGAVVAIPTRDICAFCDANSAEGVKELREVIARVDADGQTLLSAQLYERKAGAWRMFQAS